MQGVAALRPATVRDARPVVLVVGIADGELVVEGVIDSEEPGPHIDLVVVVRAPAKTIHRERVAVRCWDIGNHELP